jgi:hypothetical protein
VRAAEHNTEDVVISENPKMVLISDYNHEGSDSPPQGKMPRSITSIVSFHHEPRKLQKMLERPDLDDIG